MIYNYIVKYKKILLILLLLVLLLATFYLINKSSYKNQSPPKKEPEISTNKAPEEDIIVDYPKPNDLVTSPLIVKGKARGTWFFEGSFPVTLYYGLGGDEAIDTYATAKGEWMTEDYVEFETTI